MMRHYTLLLLLACSLTLSACSRDPGNGPEAVDVKSVSDHEVPTKGGIPWFEGSIEDAFAAAKAGNKPIFLYWGASWCPPCHELKATIFLRDEFIEQSKLFVPVYLDGDTERAQKYGEKFAVYGYPTVIIFDPAGVELTRIPGGMDIEQYLGVLELALNALRPVGELLVAVQAGQTIGDDDWRLLASYSWGQDKGTVLGDTDKHLALRRLAQACPERLTVAKSKLQMLALDAWLGEEERDETLATQYLAQVEVILTAPALSRANLNTFIYSGAGMVSSLVAEDRKSSLGDHISGELVAAIEDTSVNVLTRIDAIYGWVDVNKAVLGEGESLSPVQQKWVTNQAAALRPQLNKYQQHAAINSLWQLYYEAGLEADARATLQEGMETSKQPYYFMSGMGYLEKESGNKAAAIDWYKKAWDAAEGPATRIQWGSNYLFALIELSPDNTGEIAAAGATLFDELAQQKDGLYHRSRGRMDRLGSKLLVWAEPAEGESTTVAQRQVVLSTLRGRMDSLCVDIQPGSEAFESCESFLLPLESV